MKKLALLAFLLTNLGGVAMAAPFGPSAAAPSFGGGVSFSAGASYGGGASFRAPTFGGGPSFPSAPPAMHQAPSNGPRAAGHAVSAPFPARTRHFTTLECDGPAELPVLADLFARVPRLDGSTTDFPLTVDATQAVDNDDLNKAIMGAFEQVLNQESARQGRSVDALLAHGAVIGDNDGNGVVSLYKFDLDAEMRIVREAYLLRTPPARA